MVMHSPRRCEERFLRRSNPRNDDSIQISNVIPCASAKLLPQLVVLVCWRIYAFHASEPASRPPPVSFSPQNAPPISAPEVPMLILAIPQSLPRADKNASACCKFCVNIAEDKPNSESLCMI